MNRHCNKCGKEVPRGTALFGVDLNVNGCTRIEICADCFKELKSARAWELAQVDEEFMKTAIVSTGEKKKLNGERILIKAITKWGKEAQIFVAIEEMAELTKALSKEKRNRTAVGKTRKEDKEAIAEEIADVQIMLNQLRIIFGCRENDVENEKLERIEARLKGAQK